MKKKILYCDMDGVLADFVAGFNKTGKGIMEMEEPAREHAIDDHVANKDKMLFANLPPMKDAVWAYQQLAKNYDAYLLSTPMWKAPLSYTQKRIWVEHQLGPCTEKRLILSHNKGLLKGDYLIDDRIKNGVAEFEGEHIHFDTDSYPNWDVVIGYLSKKDGWTPDPKPVEYFYFEAHNSGRDAKEIKFCDIEDLIVQEPLLQNASLRDTFIEFCATQVIVEKATGHQIEIRRIALLARMRWYDFENDVKTHRDYILGYISSDKHFGLNEITEMLDIKVLHNTTI